MKKFELYPYFILRTPLLSYNEWINKLSKLEKEELRSHLFSLFDSGLHKEALYLASPSLLNRISELKDSQAGNKKVGKLGISLLKYFTRMSTRCTPFGLFAGLNTGTWGKENNVLLDDVGNDRRYSRLDMHYLIRISHIIKNLNKIIYELRYFPNYTLYSLGNELRYIEYKIVEEGLLHTVSSIENSEYIQLIIENARYGATPKEIVKVLESEDIPFEDGFDFVKVLISNQILVSELEPNMTGPYFFDRLIKVLEKAKDGKDDIDQIRTINSNLLEVKDILRKIDNEQIGHAVPLYASIVNTLSKLEIPIDQNKLFHVDYVRQPLNCTINYSIASDVRKGLEVLNKLSNRNGNGRINEFKEVFRDRYGSAEVPLTHALDDEIGIGYPIARNRSKRDGQILKTLPFNPISNTEEQIVWNTKNQFILEKLIQANENESYELVLKDEDISQFESNWSDVPDTFSVMISVLNGLNSYDKDKRDIYLAGFIGKSATEFIGRYTHSDSAIKEMAEDLAKKEQELDPNRVHCEISYLPSNFRIGNVINRSSLRNYEIPIFSIPSVPNNNQIDLRDIYLSIRGNRIILRSKRLNKEIIPKLSSMHNYFTDSLSMYQFLCDLDTQDKKYVHNFDWGILGRLKFLPRVRYRNIILEKAYWNLSRKDISSLKNLDLDKRKSAVENLRQRFKLPRYVLFVVSDNKLLIDLESDYSLDLLIQLGARHAHIRLEEFLFDTNDALVKDKEQRLYTNEIALTFIRKKDKVSNPIKWKKTENTSIKRSFIVGDDWLYYKIYLGIKTADRVLLEVIEPLSSYFAEQGWIDQWFFIRYYDPKYHLRVRWRLKDKRFLNEILKQLRTHINEYVKFGFIWKIQVDTYQREIERYGEKTMHLLEKFFHLDTLNIMLYFNLVGEIDIDREESNLLFGIFYLDAIMNQFNYSLPRKMDLMDSAKKDFAERLHANARTFKEASTRYKKFEPKIQEILGGEYLNVPDILSRIPSSILDNMASHNDIYEKIFDAVSKPENGMNSDYLLSSIIHMSLNRIFPSNANYYELIVYTYLHKFYTSIKNRVIQ